MCCDSGVVGGGRWSACIDGEMRLASGFGGWAGWGGGEGVSDGGGDISLRLPSPDCGREGYCGEMPLVVRPYGLGVLHFLDAPLCSNPCLTLSGWGHRAQA
jgi:hypothetical protein